MGLNQQILSTVGLEYKLNGYCALAQDVSLSGQVPMSSLLCFPANCVLGYILY